MSFVVYDKKAQDLVEVSLVEAYHGLGTTV